MKKLSLLKIFISISLCFLIIFRLHLIKSVSAVDGLAHFADMINTFEAGAPSEHSVTFTLPSNSLPLYTTDYIHLYFEAFSDITLPSMLSGTYAGIPQYTLDGKWIHITGISLQPGGYIGIHGINGTNPPVYTDYQVSAYISEDYDRLRVKNRADTFATLFRGHVDVTATVIGELAELQISGYSAPGTFIIFTEAGAVIGTDVAGPTGYYSHIFSGLQAAIHHVTYYGIDQQHRSTSPINLTVYTPAYQRTIISDQLLSPTMELSASEILTSDTLVASGSAIPMGNLTILTDAPLRSYYASASSDGLWTLNLPDTNEYIFGDYRIYALVQNNFGLQSLISNMLSFTVISDVDSGSSCGDISHGDLNCDLSVDLTDFSILMYYWGTYTSVVDINSDGRVNLTDFSILMFYWGT